ncbi:hypothetical protein [Azospirillum argentinense]
MGHTEHSDGAHPARKGESRSVRRARGASKGGGAPRKNDRSEK